MEQSNTLLLTPIGQIAADEQGFRLVLNKAFIPALTGLEGFSHLQILWWFSQCDGTDCRQTLQEASPYKEGPAVLGTFATRSPQRPNPLALSTAEVTYIDREKGEIGLAYIDSKDGTPLLDIKPYTPSLDRVENPSVPNWCAGWPKNTETSGDFDWASIFNF